MTLDQLGARLLPWLDEQVIPVAIDLLTELHLYVKGWRGVLDV